MPRHHAGRDEFDEEATPQPATTNWDAHAWQCWGNKDGAGARFQTEVRGELSSIKGRISYYNGGLGVLGLIAAGIFAWWLNTKFETSAANAVKAKDVAAAVQSAATMAAAKATDDAGLFKMMLDQRAVDISLPDVRAAKTKGNNK
jgi:hypothetical protein